MIYYFKNGNNALRFDKDTGLINEITMEEFTRNDGSVTIVKNLHTHPVGWVIPSDYVDATYTDWGSALSKLRNLVMSLAI